MKARAIAGEGSKLEYSGHAQVAYENGALEALADLGKSSQQVVDAALLGVHSTVLMPLLSGMVAAFGLTPSTLQMEDLSHILRLFAAIYEGEKLDLHIWSWCFLRVPSFASYKRMPLCQQVHDTRYLAMFPRLARLLLYCISTSQGLVWTSRDDGFVTHPH